MDKVKHTLIFKNSLTEVEENKLVTAIQVNYLEKMEKELRSWERKAPTSQIRNFLNSQLVPSGQHPFFWSYYSLVKKDPVTYEFISPDLDQLFGIKALVAQIPFLPKAIPKSKLMYNFLRTVCLSHLNRRDFTIEETKISDS